MGKGLTPEDVSDLLSQVIRVGVVTARQPEKLRVQVECRDTVTNALVTDWMQVLVPRAKEDRQYDIPDVGDQVLCLFQPFGRERGFVLGSMYAADAPPVTDGDKTHRTFKDGTTLEYDRKANRLQACVEGNGLVVVTAKGKVLVESSEKIVLKAPVIELQGNLVQQGYEGGRATSELRGSFTVRGGAISVPDDDVTAGAVALRKHTHSGVESGPDTTGKPVNG